MIRTVQSPSGSMDSVAPWSHDATLHAWWVEPGRLLAGEYPGARTPEKTRQKVRLIVDAGIDTIIDLTTPRDGLEKYEEALTAVAEQAGRQVRYYAYPIPDMEVSTVRATTRSWLASATKWTPAESFTCTAGAGRGGRPPWLAAC